ncbi:hypothetical protein ES705_18839 [subsurface metagenome]
MHNSSSKSNVPSEYIIAPTGQIDMHNPQPQHRFLSLIIETLGKTAFCLEISTTS